MDRLPYLGMFCLGAFVGGITNYGLAKIDTATSYIKVSSSIFGCAFSGVVFFFIEYQMNLTNKEKNHIYMYPLGLVMALLWLQVIKSVDVRIKSQNKTEKIIGILHIIFVATITIGIIYYLCKLLKLYDF